MTALATLRALAAGEPVANGALLQTCRLAAGGSEFYGEEEILARFRSAPTLTDEPLSLASASHAALFWPGTALFADLAGEHIARLWLLGPGAPAARETSVAVPFDPDMAQSPGDLAFAASDHPGLSPGDVGRVMQAGRDLATDWRDASDQPGLRARAFAIRAFSEGSTCAALFAVHVLSGDAVRRAGFVHAAVMLGGSGLTVQDSAGESALDAEWRPRIG